MNRPIQSAFTLSGDEQRTPPLADVPSSPISAALPITGALKYATGDLPDMPPNRDTCYCTVCRQYFKSESSFTWHRPGDYDKGQRPRCLTPDEMRAKGMAQNAKGHWVTRLYDGPPRGRRDEDADE